MVSYNIIPPPDPRIAEREKAHETIVALVVGIVIFGLGALTTLAIVALIVIAK